ncbi:MAG: hypothetical protein WCP32_14190 [Bacteroidota bacterium]
MNFPEQRIIDFIGEHHLLTLAVSRDNIPWCASCYYAYLQSQNQFIITSDSDTRHIRDIIDARQFRVAGAIALETSLVGKIRGIQFTGRISRMDEAPLKIAKAAYLKRFPIARLMPALHLWSIEPDYIKMTDNRLGFGKKLIWTTGLQETQAG